MSYQSCTRITVVLFSVFTLSACVSDGVTAPGFVPASAVDDPLAERNAQPASSNDADALLDPVLVPVVDPGFLGGTRPGSGAVVSSSIVRQERDAAPSRE